MIAIARHPDGFCSLGVVARDGARRPKPRRRSQLGECFLDESGRRLQRFGRGSGIRLVPALRCAFPVPSIFARIIPLLSLKNSSVVSRREFARETLQIIVLFRTDPAGIGQNRMNSLPNSLKAGNRTIQRRRRAPRGESGRCAINRGCAFLGATRVLLTWIRCPADPFRALDATAPVPYGAKIVGTRL